MNVARQISADPACRLQSSTRSQTLRHSFTFVTGSISVKPGPVPEEHWSQANSGAHSFRQSSFHLSASCLHLL